MLSPFMWLMLAFAAVFVVFLIPVAIFNGIHLVVVFLVLVGLIILGGFVGKALSATPKLLNLVYGIASNPIVTFLVVLISTIWVMFFLGGDIEKRLIVYGLAIIAVMLVLLPLFVRQQMIVTLMQWFISNKMFTERDVAMPELVFIILGFSLYVAAIVLSAYKIDRK